MSEEFSRDWMRKAACAGHPNPDLFFPDKAGRPAVAQIAEAEKVCQNCPVTVECDAYRQATHSSFGVWGGGMHRSTSLSPKWNQRQKRETPTVESSQCMKCGQLWAYSSGPRQNFEVVTKLCPECVAGFPSQGWGLVRDVAGVDERRKRSA
jgi:WhiB family redox-sensing transcriptional regulator